MDKLFNLIGGWNLVLSVVIVTIIVSAITVIFDGFFYTKDKKRARKRKKIITVIIALLIAITNNTFVKEDMTILSYIQTVLLTWAGAVLFYLLIGKWTIHQLISGFKKYIKGKIDKIN